MGSAAAAPAARPHVNRFRSQLAQGGFVGYPGRPRVQDETPTLLEELFKQTFGCKRLAPGFVTVTPDLLPESPRDWTTGHDATTLGGNSGSAVLIVGREQAVAGLHYGGTRSDPRVNWAHVLGRTLDETDGFSNKTLRKHLRDRDVQLVDILGGA